MPNRNFQSTSKDTMNHLRTLALLLITTACAQQTTQSSSRSAVFEQTPDQLLLAFEQKCSEPAASFVRKSDSHLQCRINMSPDATAAAILSYDGHVNDLPQVVVDLKTTPHQDGVVVQIENYLNVPQKTGSDLHVIMQSPRVGQSLTRLFSGSGGKSL
jgi:hypothetical protein